MNELLLQIQTLLRARYPILYLLSHEEERVIRGLEKLAHTEHMKLLMWKSSTGIVSSVKIAEKMAENIVENTMACTDAIQYLMRLDVPAMLVFLDVHHYLDEKEFIRLLRDYASKMVAKGQIVVCISPLLHIPVELEKMIATLDVPLPNYQECSKILEILCDAQQIDIAPQLFQRFVQGSLGLTEGEIKRMYTRIALVGNGFTEADLSLQIEEKKRSLRTSRYLEFWDTNQLQLEVGGLDNLKRWLAERKLAFSAEAKTYGLPEPKGLFLLGVQGCGKSLMAKVVAQMWQMPLLRLDVAIVAQQGAEDGLRETIRIAESLAPAILWIDELEKGFASQEDNVQQSLGTFLTWMQEKKAPVFVVATANEVRNLPPELLRKGRFDEIFFVDLPDPHERLEILDIHLRQRKRIPQNFDLTIVVEDSERYSGAELEQVVIAAMFKAFSEGREVDTEDLIESVREIVPLAVTMDDHLKDLRDWARSRARRASADKRRSNFFVDWEDS